MSENTYKSILSAVIGGNDLTREQSHWAFDQIMEGAWTEAQISGLLVALASKGEVVDEIAGAAMAMRDHALKVNSGDVDIIDTCGTGGTGLSTFNISTTAAMVCAGAGVGVAKHGNRTNTRASGSANVLAELGLNLDADLPTVTKCLEKAKVGFCFAVKFHPAMKYAVPVRKQLGVRTVFNMLGPLTNPAGAKRQLLGVFDAAWTEPVADVLATLGAVRAMVVHAEDGLDEISTTSETQISECKDSCVTTRKVKPEGFGIKRATLDDLLVESAEQSAATVRSVLSGEKGPARDIVLLNAAAGIAVADKASTIEEALPIAEKSIDSGSAAAALQKLVETSHGR